MESATSIRQARLPAQSDSWSRLQRRAWVFEHGPTALGLLDAQGVWVDCNRAFCRALGTTSERLLGRSFEGWIKTASRPAAKAQARKLLTGVVTQCVFNLALDSTHTPASFVPVRARRLFGADGAPMIIVSIGEPGPEHQLPASLVQTDANLQLALNGADLGLWLFNRSNATVQLSPGALQLLGYREAPRHWGWRTVLGRCHSHDRRQLLRSFRGSPCSEDQLIEQVLRLRRPGGGYRWLLVRGKVVEWGSDNRPLAFSGWLMDVSRWKELERRLTVLATTDELTGLLNRRFGVGQLKRALGHSDRSGRPVSMVLLDIDHFKSINDRLGHDTGDQVLAAFGHFLRTECRRGDHAIRWGGEEFAIVLPGTDPAEALCWARRLFDNMHRVAGTIESLKRLTCSMGVVTRRGGESSRALMKRADELMYRAKKTGRNRLCSDLDDSATLPSSSAADVTVER